MHDEAIEKMREIQRKWRIRWEEARIFDADPDPSKEKFYITVAYPYPNSPQHIGHGRTYGLADAYARFKRMRGYNVLLPMAFHYTGTPILAMARRLKEGDRELRDLFINVYKIPEEKVDELIEPLKMARYFHEEIKEGMKLMGYSIDWRREFTTIDPAYNRFITWQFHKLKERGYLTKGRHPVGWCPRCDNAVGQHDTKGDVEPEIGETTAIKFMTEDGLILPVITFRPETVFGVTNIWIRPYYRYKVVKVGDERWVVSELAVTKLRFQGFKVEVVDEIEGKELVGKLAENPVTGDKVIILPAEFVDPDYGTGVVMSVPAHAPYDYLALVDLKKNPSAVEKFGVDRKVVEELEPISIIRIEGFSEYPAKDVVEKLGVKNQEDPLAEKATEEVYSKEYHSGVMKENTGMFANMPVSKAKEEVRKFIIESGKGFNFYEIVNSPVYCRCGAKIVVKIVEDQWFIDYSNPEWKRLAHEALESMRIIPDELKEEFREAIDWMREKACARKSGLGTKLPFDPNWIIESLSDSTIYMAYYTISKFINQGKVKPEQFTNEVFDYIFLGKGNPEELPVDKEVLEEMRREFLYWYPLDSRHSGRDLIWNHLTFFIFNHVAIFPRELWPRQIVVNGSVTMEGKKMSKSLGNIIPIRVAVEQFGADPIRLSVLGSAEIQSDADFSAQVAANTLDRLMKMYELSLRYGKVEGELRAEGFWDKWILTRIRRHVEAVTRAMEDCRTRESINHALYMFINDLDEYMSAGTPNPQIMWKVLNVWARLIAPFAPFTAEEVWENIGGEGFVSLAKWPEPEELPSYEEVEKAYNIVEGIVEDVKKVMATGIKGSKLYIYVAAPWKFDLFSKMDEVIREHGQDPRRIIREVMKEDMFRTRGGEVPEIIRQYAEGSWPWLSSQEMEAEYLEELKSYIEKKLNVEVKIEREDLTSYDPKGRAKRALPGRPAIYLEA